MENIQTFGIVVIEVLDGYLRLVIPFMHLHDCTLGNLSKIHTKYVYKLIYSTSNFSYQLKKMNFKHPGRFFF